MSGLVAMMSSRSSWVGALMVILDLVRSEKPDPASVSTRPLITSSASTLRTCYVIIIIIITIIIIIIISLSLLLLLSLLMMIVKIENEAIGSIHRRPIKRHPLNSKCDVSAHM